MHILHIPRWYPHPADPMLGLFVKNHAGSLTSKCRNSVLYIHFVEKQAEPLIFDTHLQNGIFCCTVYVSKSSKSWGVLSKAFLPFLYFKAFRRGLKRIHQEQGVPDLTHVHVLSRPALPALWLKFFKKVPFVISEHWSRYFPQHNNYRGSLRKLFTRFALKKASALICVSESLRTAMQQQGLTHPAVYLVSNVVDVSLFKPAVKKNSPAKLKLIHISCFEDKSKNITGLLKALKIVKEKGFQFSCDLIGDGVDKPEMEKLAGKLGLFDDETVNFHGMLLPKEMVKKLQYADFLIQTSHYETFSTVVVESLACAVPVISTPVGIFPELYSPEIGIMIQSADAGTIADSIESAIQHKGTFDENLMREIAVSRFSTESVGKSLFEIYEKVTR